jgi:hypothetical protein
VPLTNPGCIVERKFNLDEEISAESNADDLLKFGGGPSVNQHIAALDLGLVAALAQPVGARQQRVGAGDAAAGVPMPMSALAVMVPAAKPAAAAKAERAGAH